MPYVHPEALVATEWLASNIDDPHLRVVDSSFKLPGITPTARFAPALVRDKQRLLDNLAVRREQVVDARAAGRFEGTAEETRPGLRRGHIPGSRNLPYDRVTDPQTRRLRDADELSSLFRDAGVALDRPIVTSCGSGVTACALAFALHLIGHPGAALYDG